MRQNVYHGTTGCFIESWCYNWCVLSLSISTIRLTPRLIALFMSVVYKERDRRYAFINKDCI